MAFIEQTTINANGDVVSVQNPLPSDGDSVYAKDINVAISSNGDFTALNELPRTAAVTDYFDSLTTVNINNTANNPKEIIIRFHRSIQLAQIGFGCNDGTKNFSNVKISILGSNDEERAISDDSANSTKYNSKVYSFVPETANSIKIEFFTVDEVGISNLIIYKSTNVNSRIQAIQPNGNLVDASASNEGNLNVRINEYGDTPAIDAFGRLRVSNPQTVFDSKQIFDNLPLRYDDQEVSGSGTGSTHNPNRASSNMTVSATTAGKRVRQTFQRFNYESGKSTLAFYTFVMGTTPSGITKEVGSFDDDNGVFLRNDGAGTSFVIRSSVTGSAVDTVFPQASWNVDKLDGTGTSGITLDITKAQILVIDYEWLGVGRVRFGFVIDGLYYYCHKVNNANNIDSVYMSTPNLPVRYSIENDGTGGADSLEHICTSVMTEGGTNTRGALTAISRVGNSFSSGGTNDVYLPAMSFRLKSGYLGATVQELAASVLCTTNTNFEVALILAPTVAGPDNAVWVDVPDSALQYDISRTDDNVLSGGRLLFSTFVGTSADNIGTGLENAISIGSFIDGTPQEIVLAIQQPAGGNESFFTSVVFRELF